MYFPTFPSMGGTERVMSIIANQFVADGHDIFIYGSSPQLEKPYFELNSLIKVSVVEGVSKKEKVSSLTKALVENHIEVLLENRLRCVERHAVKFRLSLLRFIMEVCF